MQILLCFEMKKIKNFAADKLLFDSMTPKTTSKNPDESRAQSYQHIIPENFGFSELKILLFIEVKILVRKLSFF